MSFSKKVGFCSVLVAKEQGSVANQGISKPGGGGDPSAVEFLALGFVLMPFNTYLMFWGEGGARPARLSWIRLWGWGFICHRTRANEQALRLFCLI